MEQKLIEYVAPPTISKFHASHAFVRLVLGPIGSGKSVGMCAEVVRLCKNQKPSQDGIRYSRWAIVRNTQKELKNTTIKTWLDWYQDLGTYSSSNMTFHMRFEDVDCEILFLGLDRPDQLKSLLSLELSGAFINEAREVQPEVITTIMSRLGRYPSMRDDVGCTDPRLIMDSNFPSEDSFIYNRFEENRPPNWELFKQPPALNKKKTKVSKKAENIQNLPSEYYLSMMEGQSEDWLRVHRDCEYAFLMDGKAVYPEYKESTHLLNDGYTPDPRLPIYLGLDYGRTPVAVFVQRDLFGRVVFFDELQCWDMGAETFGKLLYDKIMMEYPEFEVTGWGDPAGDERGQNDERTPMQILNKVGVSVRSSPTQDPYVRIEALRSPMEKMYDGRPAFMITPKCKMLRKALLGGYNYKRVQTSGNPRYNVKPDKNEYSHVSDAAQYVMCGLGGAVQLIRNPKSAFAQKAQVMQTRQTADVGTDWSPFDD